MAKMHYLVEALARTLNEQSDPVGVPLGETVHDA
jgi:hypothetical protein